MISCRILDDVMWHNILCPFSLFSLRSFSSGKIYPISKNVFYRDPFHQDLAQAGGYHRITQAGLPYAGKPRQALQVPHQRQRNSAGTMAAIGTIASGGTFQYLYAPQLHHDLGGDPVPKATIAIAMTPAHQRRRRHRIGDGDDTASCDVATHREAEAARREADATRGRDPAAA